MSILVPKLLHSRIAYDVAALLICHRHLELELDWTALESVPGEQFRGGMFLFKNIAVRESLDGCGPKPTFVLFVAWNRTAVERDDESP